MFAALNSGVVGRAIKENRIQLTYWNPREFTKDKHRTVDDRPYGGGPGMVMKYQPLRDTIRAAQAKLESKLESKLEKTALERAEPKKTKVIYLSPQGKTLDQQGLIDLAQEEKLILLAGRYEGIDQRLIDTEIDEEWSIGDYVLSGGELAAMVMIDGITRLLPGVLGHNESANQDSFMNGLLDCPHYTRPEVIEPEGRNEDKKVKKNEIDSKLDPKNLTVPAVLLKGNHRDIERWRLKQALGATWLKRPDLLEALLKKRDDPNLENDLKSHLEKELLDEFINEQN